MATSNLAALNSAANYSAVGNYGNLGTSSPSAAVLAKVERTLAMQSGSVTKLNDSIARDQTKLSGLGQLQSALVGFQSVAERLTGNGLSTSATSSTKGVLTLEAGGSAKAGKYAVDVKQLAQGQILNSDTLKASNTAIGTGATATIKVEFGSVDGARFEPGKENAKSIVIDSKNNTLDGIAAAFKSAGIDATVVKSGSGYTLSVKGASGEQNSMRISVTGDAAVRDLVSYDPAGRQGMTEAAAAQDAIATVDGKEIKSASNTLKDALPGVDVTLTGKGKTDVVVAQDATQIAKNVSNFVSAYNDLANQLGALQKGELKSDLALGQISWQLSQLVRTGGGTSGNALADAGVKMGSNGLLQLDEKKLNSAIAADPAAVSKLFTNDGKGLADQLDSKIDTLTGKNSTFNREVLAVSKDMTALNAKKAEMAKALTAQANALVNLYTQQEQSGANAALPGYTGGARSLFDFMV